MAKGQVQTRESILAQTRILPNGCVEWIGGIFNSGYGRVGFKGKSRRAHHIIYELLVGPIPEGLILDHLCRNKLCVAPAHLEPVTDRINILRGAGPAAINIAKTHCKRGHIFDEANTKILQPSKWTPNSGRRCRKCAVLATQRWQDRNGGRAFVAREYKRRKREGAEL